MKLTISFVFQYHRGYESDSDSDADDIGASSDSDSDDDDVDGYREGDAE